MTEIIGAFFNDRLNVITIVLLAILAVGAYIAVFGEVKEEPRKKKG